MSRARLWAVARLELLQNAKRPLFWIWIVLLALIAWSLSGGNMRVQSGDSTVGGTKAWITSEFAMAQILSIFVPLCYCFFVAVAAGMTVIRDDELEVSELLHSTPLRPSEYVWGKFVAVIASCLVVLALHLCASAFFNHVTADAESAEFVGPFQAWNYVKPALVFALPMLVFLAGTSFAVGAGTRRPILVFVLPVAVLISCVFFLWFWSPSWLDPRVNRLLMLIDPAGHRWLLETWLKVDRGVDFYNSAPVPLDVAFAASRLGFVLLGLVPVAWVRRRLARSLRGVGEGRARSVKPAAAASAADPTRGAQAPPRATLGSVAELGMRVRRPGRVRAAFVVASTELRELRRQPGLYLFVPLIVLQTVANSALAVDAFGTPLLATPGTLAVRSLGWLVTLGCLLLMFYTLESLRREDGARLGSIYYATPTRTISLLAGKLLANSIVVLVLLLVTLATCSVVLLFQGQVALDLVPFLIVWGLLLPPTLVLWCAFVSALYAITRSRYTVYALSIATLVYTGRELALGEMSWVGNWPLWGSLIWTDMGLFELDGTALLLNRLGVLGLAVFLIALAARLFPRRDHDVTRSLLALRPRPLARTILGFLPYAAAPLVLGILLHREVEAGFQSERIEKMNKDYWRKNVATWTDAPVPDIASADIDLELEPGERRFRVDGSFELVNRGEEPLRHIALTGSPFWDDPQWTLNGEEALPEDRERLYVFTPDAPLEPNARLRVGFQFAGSCPSGSTENGGGLPEFILPSGVVLTSFRPTFVPIVGYAKGIGVDEDNGYDSKEYADDFYEGITPSAFGPGAPYPVRVRITAPEEYTLNSVGTLVSEEVTGGRRSAVWETDHPVSFFNVVAGKWALRRGEGTAIYHHPEHTYNLDEMIEALDGARRWFSEWFYPYPWQDLKLSEFPALAGYAQGFATNITFSEGIGFLAQSDPRANAAFVITAHEAAHQWWGNILSPGRGPGGNILSEGMAHFSTILLCDELKGERQRIEFCRRIEDRYCDDRQPDSERELVKIDGDRPGDTTVTYDKGGWVFWMLLHAMERDNALAGLRSFIGEYAASRDHPVLQDLVEHLRGFAPDAEAYERFARQWFFDVVVPEYRVTGAEREHLTEDGGQDTWEARATVRNIGSGHMPIVISAERGERFPDDDSEDPADDTRFRDERVTIVLGPDEEREVVLHVAFEPERLVVDPDVLVLQLNREQALHRF